MDKPPSPSIVIALAGNPNSGKTTLFNVLTGLRMQTGNYTGTTVAKKSGVWEVADRSAKLIDLPGMYSLDAATKEEEVASEVLHGDRTDVSQPNIVMVVMDATNLERNLFLFSQLTECDLPLVVVLTMMDRAHREGIEIDVPALNEALGCTVVPVNAPAKEGLEALAKSIEDICTFGIQEYPRAPQPSEDVKCGVGCQGCPFHGRFSWSESVVARVVRTRHATPGHLTESLDEVLTHSFFGVVAFLGVMFLVFYAIFSLATVPMDLIEGFFGVMGEWVEARMPEGDFQSFLIHGVIGGAGGVLVFLPQICLLFFLLSLLEDPGYLSRAAFVMDRVMKRVGLPGTAFVPLLSGHACAIPAIMSTRVISDARDRLATILVLPLTSCSARIPVYIFDDFPAVSGESFRGGGDPGGGLWAWDSVRSGHGLCAQEDPSAR